MKNNLTLEDKDNQVILKAYKKLLRHSKSIISKNDSKITHFVGLCWGHGHTLHAMAPFKAIRYGSF